ncbi:MAG: hypothetical protein ACFCU4_11550 [Puniceicoccaceae bacterium]
MKPVSVFALSFLLAGSAAANTFSISPFLQWLDTDLAQNTGFGARGGVALPIGRIEVEWSRTDLNSEKSVEFAGFEVSGVGDGTANLFFLNYRFTQAFTDRIAAFAGAGAGGTFVEFEFESRDGRFKGDGNDLIFTYQFFAGVEFYILPKLSISGGYKWVSFDDSVVEDRGFEVEIITGNSSAWEAALTFYF